MRKMDENITNTAENVITDKKSSLLIIIIYFMAILLIITTVMCCFMAYNLHRLNEHTEDNSHKDTVSTDTSADTNIADGYALMSDDMLSELKDDSYSLGKSELLASIKTMMEGGDTTLKMLRSLYPDYLIYNQTGGFVFKDINTNLAMHDYDEAGFKITENENEIPTNVEYYENDKLVSYKGIDVSKYNGDIDWTKVKADGVDYAMLRAVVRGYGTEGNLKTDEAFEKNAREATENGLSIGAYVFSQAITVEEAIEEAELVLSMVEPYDIKYPIVMDIEEIQNDDGRTEALSPKELTDIALAFCNKIKEAGYTPMIYCNLKGFIGLLEFERLEGIEKWYAYYGNELYFPYEVSMWQYSSTGKVDGINGNVDLNISFKNYE